MKKNLLELSIEEFVRVLCDMPERYTINFHNCTTNQDEVELIGTYDELYQIVYDTLVNMPQNTSAQRCLSKIEEDLFDYDVSISKTDVYDYLEERTKGFQQEKCKIILDDMEMYHCMYINEERQYHINTLIEKGWDDYKVFEQPDILQKDTFIQTIDYKDAYNKIFGVAYDFMYYESISLLKEKIKPCEPQQGKVLEAVDDDIVLPSGLDNDEAKELFKRAIEAGLMEKVDGGFKWKKAKWLLSYFAELVSDKFKLGKGEYNGKPRKSWKPFEVIFGIEKLGNRKNDYQKGGNLPFDYKLIDSLFEE